MKSPVNLVDLQQENAISPVWRQAFRPFFLAGSLFSAVAMAIWGFSLAAMWVFQPYGNVFFWHAHEMVFGFVGAIIVGFLLTAVQNWTGLRATHGKPLMLLFFTWLLARVLLFINPPLPAWSFILIDNLFYLLAALFMAGLVVRAGNKRNYFFVPVLLLLALTNTLSHWSLLAQQPAYFSWGINAAVMLIGLIMIVIGGRIMPMFTANGTGTNRVNPLPWLEKTVLFSAIAIVLPFLVNLTAIAPKPLCAVIFAIAALANGYRALRWRTWITLRYPLLWSLHLAYWFIPVSFLLFALHYAGLAVSFSAALHALTAGAMGSMILAMLARVSLGHTGRSLEAPKGFHYAFYLIILAGVVRTVSALFPGLISFNAYFFAVIGWSLAYLLFLIKYFKILTTARVDGRPG